MIAFNEFLRERDQDLYNEIKLPHWAAGGLAALGALAGGAHGAEPQAQPQKPGYSHVLPDVAPPKSQEEQYSAKARDLIDHYATEKGFEALMRKGGSQTLHGAGFQKLDLGEYQFNVLAVKHFGSKNKFLDNTNAIKEIEELKDRSGRDNGFALFSASKRTDFGTFVITVTKK